MLFATDAASFMDDETLQQEVFGAASLIVVCPDPSIMHALTERFEGQLTLTIHMEDTDLDLAWRLLPTLERKAGRILVNGFPTGVEVSHAMVHGGPFPATSDPHFTSVGTLSVRRFVRPVCYQNLPAALLPPALQDGNPRGIWRSIDGQPGRY
jgi:NADP-dependent aldehyde dehydrogenase